MRFGTLVLIDLAVILALLFSVAAIGYLWLRQVRRAVDDLEIQLGDITRQLGNLAVRDRELADAIHGVASELHSHALQSGTLEERLIAQVEPAATALRLQAEATTHLTERHSAILKAIMVTVAALRPAQPQIVRDQIECSPDGAPEENQ